MVRYITFFGSFLATLGFILRYVFGTLFLYLEIIASDGYYQYKSIKYEITPVSIGQVLILIGIFLILISEIKGTNKFVAWGALLIAPSFLMEIIDEFFRFSCENPLPLVSGIIIALSSGFGILGLICSLIGYRKLRKYYRTFSWIGVCSVVWISIQVMLKNLVNIHVHGILYTVLQDISLMLIFLPFLILGWSFALLTPQSQLIQAKSQ